MLKPIKEFVEYCLCEKVVPFKIGSALQKCAAKTTQVEHMCGWGFDSSEKLRVFRFFVFGLCIYAIISHVFSPIADELSIIICETEAIPNLFVPVVKLGVSFYIDKKVCECLDELF